MLEANGWQINVVQSHKSEAMYLYVRVAGNPVGMKVRLAYHKWSQSKSQSARPKVDVQLPAVSAVADLADAVAAVHRAIKAEILAAATK